MTYTKVKIYVTDYDGSKSGRTYVKHLESLEGVEKLGWKYEILGKVTY